MARKNCLPPAAASLTSSFAGAIVMIDIQLAKILDDTPILIGESRARSNVRVFQFRVN